MLQRQTTLTWLAAVVFATGMSLCINSMAATSTQPTAAFMQPEVMQAALDLKLSDSQKPQFLTAVTTFTSARAKAISNLLRKSSQTNIPRKIKGKTNTLLKKMDKSMFKFLTEEQKPAYEIYRQKLKANLRTG